MSERPYRAWRFRLPDIEAPAGIAGMSVGPLGSIEMAEGYESVRQAILLLISTVPGERVMRPDYGCDLHKLIFSPNDETTAGLAIHYVRRALDRWEPRIDVLRLDARRNALDPARLDILLDYRLRATHRDDALAFSVSLNGELT